MMSDKKTRAYLPMGFGTSGISFPCKQGMRVSHGFNLIEVVGLYMLMKKSKARYYIFILPLFNNVDVALQINLWIFFLFNKD